MLDYLFIHWHVNPELFHIGPLSIRWYSLLFVSGFILGWYIFRYFFRREAVPEKLLDPLLYTLLIATVVGARLGHCLFYQPDYYLGSWKGFWEIFMPWKGGLASHGGAIALLLGMWWFSARYGKKNHFDFLWIMDRLVITVAFAGAFIRLGNLFNSEIYGDVTSLPWGVIFDLRGETEPKHPTQIYESLSYLILGLGLLWTYRKRLDKMYRGAFFGIFLIGCFGMRFLIEFIKEPQVGFEENMVLNMGQLLSIPFIIAGIALIAYAQVKKTPARIVRH
ncbi:MAG: prolipoprotein diacylglyceryl transferase [Candidatus Cryptobacteroides sp.]|nr:prolipoprotein diacylglyceryl transferase [Candidatus Cryptobacteroides sp.]